MTIYINSSKNHLVSAMKIPDGVMDCYSPKSKALSLFLKPNDSGEYSTVNEDGSPLKARFWHCTQDQTIKIASIARRELKASNCVLTKQILMAFAEHIEQCESLFVLDVK